MAQATRTHPHGRKSIPPPKSTTGRNHPLGWNQHVQPRWFKSRVLTSLSCKCILVPKNHQQLNHGSITRHLEMLPPGFLVKMEQNRGPFGAFQSRICVPFVTLFEIYLAFTKIIKNRCKQTMSLYAYFLYLSIW